MISSVHNRELAFYRLASEKFKWLHCPRFIYGEEMSEKQEGVILMEDFTGRCAKGISPFKGLSKKQVLPIVEDLVRIQCQSLNLPKLEHTYPQINSVVQAVSKYALMSSNALATRNLSWFTSDIVKKIAENAQLENLLSLYSPQTEIFGMPPVLVHADLWPGNLLWEKKDDEEKPKMLAILDWQCLHAGSFTTDLAVLIGVSMDGEVRRKEEAAILEYFYQKLQEYKKLVNDVEVNVTFEQFENSYKKSLRYSVLPMLMTVVFNPKEDVPEKGEVEGILTKRFKLLLEDVFGK
uniref:CHK kinase-like domain-containing protein n=1 Tax=Acrobeloides nanus TaxID=290746 RepID=A0A914ECQ7_9BILA